MRKICIITGTRAEWGLFCSLAKELKKQKDHFDLQIMAVGMHFSEEFGTTYKEIEKDGFEITKRVDMLASGDTEKSTVESVSRGISGISDALGKIKPDLIFLLGDRFETFAAATAAFLMKIPIAHIHGGELTEGALDDALRHSITKMSSLHFTSAEVYSRRVIQMGEDPRKVFNVGALGLDGIKEAELLSKEEVEEELSKKQPENAKSFKFLKRNVLITFHPVTLEDRASSTKQFDNLLKVVGAYEDTSVIFTRPNADMYSSDINSSIDEYFLKHEGKAACFASLGRRLYHNTVHFCDLVAGNSSSGILEVPSFGLPTVNIGDRQKGRIKPESVIDAGEDIESIKNAFKKALSSKFRDSCRNVENPYGDGNTAEKIVEKLKKIDSIRIRKTFFDVDFKL